MGSVFQVIQDLMTVAENAIALAKDEAIADMQKRQERGGSLRCQVIREPGLDCGIVYMPMNSSQMFFLVQGNNNLWQMPSEEEARWRLCLIWASELAAKETKEQASE